jgi:multimeric flavodoxin WrbA
MGKKILILSSSPRKDGNSEQLCMEFMRGVKETGNEVELISLRGKKMNFCLGCEVCQRNGGICIHKDDVSGILDKILACDVLVLATPVYYYGFAAQMKTLIDRTFAKVGMIQNKDAYLLMTGASPRQGDMNVLVASYRSFIGCFDHVTDKGIVYGTGAMEKGEIGKESLTAAYEMGRLT